MFRSALGVVSGIALNNIFAGSISDSVLAGIGVSTKIMMFPFSFILGFGAGFQPVAGFNWGAKRYDRVRECYRFSAKTALTGSVIAGLALGIFAPQVIQLFTESDPDMMYIGSLCIRLQCVALPIHAWGAVVNMFCAGLGYVHGAMLIAIVPPGQLLLPGAPVSSPLAHFFRRIWRFAATPAVADALRIVIIIPILRKVMRMVNEAEAEYRMQQKG